MGPKVMTHASRLTRNPWTELPDWFPTERGTTICGFCTGDLRPAASGLPLHRYHDVKTNQCWTATTTSPSTLCACSVALNSDGTPRTPPPADTGDTNGRSNS